MELIYFCALIAVLAAIDEKLDKRTGRNFMEQIDFVKFIEAESIDTIFKEKQKRWFIGEKIEYFVMHSGVRIYCKEGFYPRRGDYKTIEFFYE